MEDNSPLIFLSYATPDRDRVVVFADWLNQNGFNTWMDFRNIKAGQNWDFEIRRVLGKATIFIAFLSENSIDRRSYLQREIKIALDNFTEKLPDDIYIIPVLLDKVQIPYDIEKLKIHFVDSTNEFCFEQIAESINHQLGRIGIKQKEISKTEGVRWNSTYIKENWNGLPGYNVELQIPNFQSEEYINISQITDFIKGELLNSLFEHREIKLFQESERFNFLQDEFFRTNTFNASFFEPIIIGKVISLKYSIDWYGSGAAHPNYHYQNYVFVLNPLFRIKNLEDVFIDNESAFEVIQRSVRNQLYNLTFDDGENSEVNYLDKGAINDGTTEWGDFSTFIFHKDKIEVIFSPYQVGAYVYGAQVCEVEYSKVVEFMKVEYKTALDLQYL